MTVDDVFFFLMFFSFLTSSCSFSLLFFDWLSLFSSALTRFLGSTPFSRSISKLPCPPRTHLPVPALTFEVRRSKCGKEETETLIKGLFHFFFLAGADGRARERLVSDDPVWDLRPISGRLGAGRSTFADGKLHVVRMNNKYLEFSLEMIFKWVSQLWIKPLSVLSPHTRFGHYSSFQHFSNSSLKTNALGRLVVGWKHVSSPHYPTASKFKSICSSVRG